ncbi:TonB-dependent receptor plug domain-containing protein [Caulobacter segnis]
MSRAGPLRAASPASCVRRRRAGPCRRPGQPAGAGRGRQRGGRHRLSRVSAERVEPEEELGRDDGRHQRRGHRRLPRLNLAESLQRLPGISIDRDNGEGRTISVRGLSGDFSRVRINNMEALSTARPMTPARAPSLAPSTSTPSLRSCSARSACEVLVRRGRREGSLGATADLITGRPFDYKGSAAAFSAEDSITGTARSTRRASRVCSRTASSTARWACWSRPPGPSAIPRTTTTPAGRAPRTASIAARPGPVTNCRGVRGRRPARCSAP